MMCLKNKNFERSLKSIFALQRRTPGLYIIYTLYCDNFIKKCKRERWKLHTFSLNNHCNFNYFVDIKICLIRLKCTILICYIVKMLPIDYNVLKCFFLFFRGLLCNAYKNECTCYSSKSSAILCLIIPEM